MSHISIACVALHNGKILLAHRNPTGQMGGRWEFPGGKVDAGESDEEAIVRECREEFGINVKVGRRICESSFLHNGEQFLLHAYRIFVPHDGIAVPYTLTEHSEYRWADIGEVPSLHFVDSDMKLYPCIKEYVADVNAGKAE